jgi:hypothetical protein
MQTNLSGQFVVTCYVISLYEGYFGQTVVNYYEITIKWEFCGETVGGCEMKEISGGLARIIPQFCEEINIFLI